MVARPARKGARDRAAQQPARNKLEGVEDVAPLREALDDAIAKGRVNCVGEAGAEAGRVVLQQRELPGEGVLRLVVGAPRLDEGGGGRRGEENREEAAHLASEEEFVRGACGSPLLFVRSCKSVGL